MKDIDLQKEIEGCQTEEEVAAMCDKHGLDREAVMRDRRQCKNAKQATREDFDRTGCQPILNEKKGKKKKKV